MSVSSEVLLISAVIRSKDHTTASHAGVKTEWFHVCPDEWEWVEDYIKRHRRTPSRSAFHRKFPTFKFYRADDVEHFVEEVKADHARQTLIDLIDGAVMGLQDESSVARTLDGLHTGIIALQSDIHGSGAALDIVDDWRPIYKDVLDRMDRVDKHGQAGVPTGFPLLDELTGGPQPGDYWVVAARLGQGKTWSLIRFACAALFSGYDVSYHALEQTRTQISLRMHTFMSSKYGKETFRSVDLMRGRNFNILEYKRFLMKLRSQIKGHMYVSDASRGKLSVPALASSIEVTKPDIQFVDYLTLMSQTGDDWRATAALSSGIKGLCVRYNVPIVVAAQINRTGMGKEPPGTEHLSQSDAIGQDADVVVTMKQMTKSVIKMRLAKNRNGPDNELWYCSFIPNTGKFEEISEQVAHDQMDLDREASVR